MPVRPWRMRTRVAFAKEIARSEGILVGISAGAALREVLVDWAKKPENEGKDGGCLTAGQRRPLLFDSIVSGQ